jgi:hypothetical protein
MMDTCRGFGKFRNPRPFAGMLAKSGALGRGRGDSYVFAKKGFLQVVGYMYL